MKNSKVCARPAEVEFRKFEERSAAQRFEGV